MLQVKTSSIPYADSFGQTQFIRHRRLAEWVRSWYESGPVQSSGNLTSFPAPDYLFSSEFVAENPAVHDAAAQLVEYAKQIPATRHVELGSVER